MWGKGITDDFILESNANPSSCDRPEGQPVREERAGSGAEGEGKITFTLLRNQYRNGMPTDDRISFHSHRCFFFLTHTNSDSMSTSASQKSPHQYSLTFLISTFFHRFLPLSLPTPYHSSSFTLFAIAFFKKLLAHISYSWAKASRRRKRRQVLRDRSE